MKTTISLTLAAALALALAGCEAAAVQAVEISLATPTPTAETVSFYEAGAGDQPAYGMSVLSPYQGAMQEDGTYLTEDGERLPVMELVEPSPTIPLTPTPVPTAPPPTPTPTPPPAPTAAPTPTEEPEPTAKVTKKPAKTPKPTAKPASTPKATPSAAPVATLIVTPTPTATAAITQAPTPTATPVQTSAQEPPSVSGPYSGEDVLLAARVAYFESGKSEDGYRAVLCVILNRVESSKWPSSVYDVVYQKSQFSVVGRSDFLTKTIPDSVIGYANDVLNNGNRLLANNVISFRSAQTDKTWGTRTYIGTYGGNDFYS